MGIAADVQKLEPGELVELFELDATAIGANLQRFHGYTQLASIWWQGNEYEPWAIQAKGFQRTSDAQQPAPTLTVGNIGMDVDGNPIPGLISSLCIAFDDLVGAKVTRHRTLGKYLDAVNFPDGNSGADPTAELTPEIWLVEQKTDEDSEAVEFTLSSAIDFGGQQLPSRQIVASVCSWLWKGGYRGPNCGYTGTNYFDVNDVAVLDPALDVCPGRLSSCRLRFGQDQVVNFGSYPSADRITG